MGASTAAATSSAAQPTAVAADAPVEDQLPLDEFFGVPSDPIEASTWAFDMRQRGVRECMNERGWFYSSETYEEVSGAGNLAAMPTRTPNNEFFDSLAPIDQQRYALDRWGDGFDRLGLEDVQVACEDLASDRSHPLNLLPDEHAELESAIANDQRLSVVEAAYRQCLAAKPVPPSIGPYAEEQCRAEANLDDALRTVIVEHETAFIDAHREILTALKEQRP